MFDLWKKWMMLGGIQRCFDNDGEGTGGGGEDGNAGDGGDAGDKGNKGDKGDNEGGKKEPENYEVKIGGETKLLTLDELKEYASKSAGADKLMREAAEMRKGAASGIEIKEAFEKVMKSDNVDTSDIRKLAGVLGVDQEEMVKMFNDELDKQGSKKDKTVDSDKKIGKDQLDDETKDILEQAKQAQIAEAEKEILRMCKESVDKDEFFGKIISETPEENRGDKREVILAMVHRDVRGKILASPYTQEKFGAGMIQNSIQTVRSELKKYGIPSKSSKQSAISNVLAALGPTGGLPAEVQSNDKIERIPSTEADYEDNVVKRLGQKMVQSLANKVK